MNNQILFQLYNRESVLMVYSNFADAAKVGRLNSAGYFHQRHSHTAQPAEGLRVVSYNLLADYNLRQEIGRGGDVYWCVWLTMSSCDYLRLRVCDSLCLCVDVSVCVTHCVSVSPCLMMLLCLLLYLCRCVYISQRVSCCLCVCRCVSVDECLSLRLFPPV